MSVRVLGTQHVLAQLGNVSKKMEKKIQSALKDAGKQCYKSSQADCPVGKSISNTMKVDGKRHRVYSHHKGSLKGSGQILYPNDWTVVVKYGGQSTTGDMVDYEWYVELGTSKMNARPYLYPGYLWGCNVLEAELHGITQGIV